MQFVFFALGTIFGSFFGVIIDRLPAKRNIVSGRSKCDVCKTVLKPWDLVPLFSYLLNQGRCRYCKTALRRRYLYLEILTGFVFLLSYQSFLLSFDLILALIFVSILIIIAFIDMDTMMIYDEFHFIIIILSLVELIYNPSNLKSQLLGAVIISIPYLLLAVITQGIGGGDVKLSFSAGFFLGTPNVVVGFILAVILGGIHAVYLLKIKDVDLKTAIPFGPYLCIGFFVASLYGVQIASWYLAFLL